jgi:outer membrane protein
MKNISVILNIVLLVAVAVLYFLYFSGPSASSASSNGSVVPSEFKIAYVKTDSVVKHYEYVKKTREIMEAKAKRLDQDLQKRADGLRGEFAAYQRNVNSMTLGQVKAVEEDLAKKEQNLQLFQRKVSQEVMDDQDRLRVELYDKVTAYLDKYGKDKGIQFILKFDQSSDVLQASEAFDVTSDVIKGLNEEYKSEGTVKTDSTSVKK